MHFSVRTCMFHCENSKIPEIIMHVGVTKPQPRGTTLTLMEKGEKDEPWVIGVTCASLGERSAEFRQSAFFAATFST